jgi:hypothetical protein
MNFAKDMSNSSAVDTYLLTITNNKAPENTQLNMFSDRSYEWWEAGNRLNADTKSQVCYGTSIRNSNDNRIIKNSKQRLKLQTNSAYEGNHSAYSNVNINTPLKMNSPKKYSTKTEQRTSSFKI